MHIRKKTINLYRRIFYLFIPSDYAKGKNQSYPQPIRDTGSFYGAETAVLSSLETVCLSSLLCLHLQHISPPTCLTHLGQVCSLVVRLYLEGFCQFWVFPCACFLCKPLVFFNLLFARTFLTCSTFFPYNYFPFLLTTLLTRSLIIQNFLPLLSFHYLQVQH